MNLRQAAIAIALLAAIVASWLLIERRGARQAAPAANVESGYYLREATIEGLDETGARIYTLRAARIVEQPDNERILLEDVSLEYALDDGPPWQLDAAGGEIAQCLAVVVDVYSVVTSPPFDILRDRHTFHDRPP